MSTVLEIERAIEKLPSEQQAELRRWMDTHLPKTAPSSPSDATDVDAWLTKTTGLAKGVLTTDERMQETRGEDWILPSVNGGGLKVPLDELHDLAADAEYRPGDSKPKK